MGEVWVQECESRVGSEDTVCSLVDAHEIRRGLLCKNDCGELRDECPLKG